MQTIMLGLKSVPGVMGSMLSDDHGRVMAQSFPLIIDLDTLTAVSGLVNDNIIGLHDATGGIKLIDIRTELGRIIIKTLPHMCITLLCEPTVNIPLLTISLNVVVKKLEKMTPEQLLPPASPAVSSPAVSSAPPVEKKLGKSIGPPPSW